jgi:hypothetical protein
MKDTESDSLSNKLFAYSAVYQVPIAAALWCGVPASEAQTFLEDSSVEVDPGVFESPFVENLAAKCRAIHHAIERGFLRCCGEHGRIIEDYVPPARRYVARRDLKQWMESEFEGEKPAFLFGEIDVGKSRVPTVSPRAETTYLNIIGALLDLLVDKDSTSGKRSRFPSQAAVIGALESRFPGKEGLSERTLQDKFAAAKRSLDQ